MKTEELRLYLLMNMSDPDPEKSIRQFDEWLVDYAREVVTGAIEFVDSTPAVTWTGKGGVKERLNEFLEGLRCATS